MADATTSVPAPGVAGPRAPEPGDEGERHRIARQLDENLFVDAGAGSGKTHALVGRVLGLVTTGTASLGSVAAITFTEKAAAELRDRVRTRLERAANPSAAADRSAGEAQRTRAREALDDLDGAAITTLHAFAQRILTEHAIEAGLPPRVEVLDAVASEVTFDERWASYRERLVADLALERTLLLALAHGIRVDHLRHLARTFDDNWDLAAARVPQQVPDPPPLPVDGAVARATELCQARERCADGGDTLVAHLDEIEEICSRLAAAVDESQTVEVLAELRDKLSGRRKRGRKPNWAGTDLDALRAEVQAVGDEVDQLLAANRDAVIHRLAAEIASFTLSAARERRAAGRLEFHDLLVLARDLLRGPHAAAVHDALHRRYTHLLIDEFQDTDPIQVDLAVRIAAPAPDPGAEWTELKPVPGRLFFVGDPLQSIYRFRRADIGLYLEAASRYASGLVELSANFRTAAPVVDWVNHTFGRLVAPAPGAQPQYRPLRATRHRHLAGPAVAVVGTAEHTDDCRAPELREREARDVAAVARAAIDDGWEVEDRDGTARPARWGDVAILVPARTSLPQLEAALDAARVPYRAESSSLVYATRAVRDLLATARAVDDPTDELALVTALRSPGFGCGDDDLYTWWRGGGRWDPSAPVPDGVADHPVARAFTWLAALRADLPWCSAGEVLERIVVDRRLLELGFAAGRPRDLWRRLRYVVDQARAWDEAEGGPLRSYLRWVARQSAEGARVSEAVLPETDDDSVRILTVHAAKGLEFPVCVVSGTTTRPSPRYAVVEVVWPPGDGPPGYRFQGGGGVSTAEFDDYVPIDEQMGHHERLRLLYVACTRARDHLVVSLHRVARNVAEDERRTAAELLARACEGATHAELAAPQGPATDAGAPAATSDVTGDDAEPDGELPSVDEWEQRRQGALAAAARPRTLAATAITAEGTPDLGDDAGLHKQPRDLDLPPWLKGRYGTAVGRAVHGALQSIDLATGAGMDETVAAQCEAEAVPDRADDVHRLVAAALASPTVQEAARCPHWREVYAATPLAHRLLEGYVDLLFRTAEGLVVVDYKTAATSDRTELDRRLQDYRAQGGAYASAVARTTGEPVTRVVFVFLTPHGAVDVDLGDLPRAVAEVEALASDAAIASADAVAG